MEIHERIRLLRIQKGMTQEELAKRTGYKSRAAINKIELGYVDIPCRKLEGFARALDVPPLYLTGWGTQLTSEQESVLLRYRSLTEKHKAAVLCFADELIALQK